MANNEKTKMWLGFLAPLIAKLVDVIWDNIRQDSKTVKELDEYKERVKQLEAQVENARRIQ
jgi:cell division protein FtsB